jgi:hypothetical protein
MHAGGSDNCPSPYSPKLHVETHLQVCGVQPFQFKVQAQRLKSNVLKIFPFGRVVLPLAIAAIFDAAFF